MKRRVSPAMLVGGFLFCLLALAWLWVGGVAWSDAHPDVGVNAPSVKWLPEAATNVSFYKTYSWTAYEFDIDEAGFRKWAKKLDLRPIQDAKFINRHSWREFSREANERCNETGELGAWVYPVERKHFAVVRNGLFHKHTNGVNGGQTHLVYDRDDGRAYYTSNQR